MNRTLSPITEAVSKAELYNILAREIYSVKDKLNENSVRRILTQFGIDYDEAAKDAENTDEIIALLQNE